MSKLKLPPPPSKLSNGAELHALARVDVNEWIVFARFRGEWVTWNCIDGVCSSGHYFGGDVEAAQGDFSDRSRTRWSARGMTGTVVEGGGDSTAKR